MHVSQQDLQNFKLAGVVANKSEARLDLENPFD